jgi:hypothetical protein
MPRRKPITRKKRHHPFPVALRVAKSQLALYLKTREQLLEDLKVLNRDIPNLERTVRALEAQLNKNGSTGAVSPPASQTDSKKVGGVLPVSPILDEIPPEIRAQLPPEDLSGAGSYFGAKPAPSEDFLPEIDGKEVIPEKK